MPSPFPGMDPYLEEPDLFPDLHDSLIAYLRETLNASLPPPYYAAIASRVWTEKAGQIIGPDVRVQRPRESAKGNGPKLKGRTAVAELAPTAPYIIPVFLDDAKETYLEIHAKKGKERLVASLEVLSMSNKSPRDKGRKLYLKKQRGLLKKKVHLVEIDLLRGGKHASAVPHALVQDRAGDFDYHICIRQFDREDEFQVYAWSLAQRLPEFAVPLLPGDGSVRVNLQELFDRCYDTGHYERRIDYSESPPGPPLTPEESRWLRATLKKRTER